VPVSPLAIDVIDARADGHAAVPTLLFGVRVVDPAGGRVDALALRCQIRIEPQRRRYQPSEERRLYEVFGDTPQWGESLRPLLWTHVSVVVPGFDGTGRFDLPIACTYDFEVAATKYLHALDDGIVPLRLLWSGTIFHGGRNGMVVEPVPWHLESTFLMPAATWKEVMDLYFPDQGWLRLRRDTLDRLQEWKARNGVPTWDQAFDLLLDPPGVEACPAVEVTP
jgi:Family of unknown function (DUF6084)